MVEKIKATMIFEVLGKPAEYLEESLNQIVGNLGKEKGVKIIESKVHEPKAVEKSDLFSSFSEVELEAEDISRLIIIMFNYMPAHIEIISPSEMRMKNFDMSAVCNELMTKLHGYDSVAKTLMFERNNLIKQITSLTSQVTSAIPENKEEKSSKVKKKKRV